VTGTRWILQRHADLEENETARLTYLCTAEAARIVNREADRHLLRHLRARLRAETAFDRHGTWIVATQRAVPDDS
jgi:ribosomal protein S18 acetylase RimI-like enzyme